MWIVAILIVLVGQASAHLMEGLYCGETNCYDVLNVTRDNTKGEIAKIYRVLARRFHPDNRDTGDEEKFKVVANAYEILKDDEARKDYDYMLDNPEAYYQNYYRYYRRKGPKVDIRLVLLSTITVISAIQYFVRKSRYDEAVNYFVSVRTCCPIVYDDEVRFLTFLIAHHVCLFFFRCPSIATRPWT